MSSSLRQILRRLRRAPLFSAVAALTLALGIGACVAVFSVVHAVLLEPLPYPEPERLVGVWHTAPGLGWDLLNQSPALYFIYREESRTFVDSGMWDGTRVTVTGLAEPEQIRAMRVTDGTLPLLGIEPFLGRRFTAEDDSPGSPETVILGHGYWQRRLGSDPGVLGTVLQIDGEPHEVIGVMPKGTRFLDRDPDLYLPFRFDRAELFFGNFSYQGVARLAPGVSLEEAAADVARMIPLAVEAFPMPGGFTPAMVREAGLGPNIRPLSRDVVGDVGQVLWLLLGTAALVLLVATANVANLFLVRAEGRHQELALRQALGAGRGTIARELMGEGLALGLLGGAAGLALAWGGIRVLRAVQPPDLPRLGEIAVDSTVALFALAITLAASLVFGAFPAVKMKTLELTDALKEGGRSGGGRARHRARNALVVAQISLALVLLVGSGLMLRTFRALGQVEPGFDRPAEVLTGQMIVSGPGAVEAADRSRLYERIFQRLAALPGVESVGLSTSITMDGNDSNDPVFVEAFPGPPDAIPPLRRFKWISPGYFETMGNPLLAGRPFTWDDVHARAPVAVVTENLARLYWQDPADALGQRIRQAPDAPWREIVGIVGDVRDDGLAQPPTPVVYWPLAMRDFWEPGEFVPDWMAFAVRGSRVGTEGFADEVRRAVWAVDRDLPLADVEPLTAILARSTDRTSFTLALLAVAAAIALLLGAVGIYGVTSYAAGQRTREIGVRMAMGARPRDVSRLVLGHGAALAAAGVTLGLAAAAGLTRLMAALLYGVEPIDPATYALVGLMMIAVALLASYLPARRAAGLDPLEALR